jgi:hypothetical protein
LPAIYRNSIVSDEADAASAEAVAIMPAESAAVQDLRGGAVPLGTQLITWSPLPSTCLVRRNDCYLGQFQDR